MVHKTKGIILRTVKYGDTSIITTVYTELFGVQTYIVKGVRQSSKKTQSKANYFQPAAILEMEVYHNELKQMQFIKEYQWSFFYENIFFDVMRNAVAMYVIELLQHSLKQPEAHPELFYFIENTLHQLDKGNDSLIANLPLHFTLHLGSELGFKILGEYNSDTTVIDLQEGNFVKDIPLHQHYLINETAQVTSQLLLAKNYKEASSILLNRNIRKQLLEAYQNFMRLHITGFGELRSVGVLQEIFA